MGRFNKIGKRYGKLEVKEYLGNLRYKCLCDCGRTCIVVTGSLRNDGKGVYECEFCREEKRENKPLKGSKVGKRFGKLTVTKYLGNRLYECHCDCGNDCITRSYNLRKEEDRRGQTSCGCDVVSYSKNEKFFEKIDTEEKAYILGFIATDGHVNIRDNNLKITIKKDDEEILEKMKDCMEFTGPIHLHDIHTKLPQGIYKDSKVADLTICCKKMVLDLVSLGFTENKTYELKIDWDKIPSSLIPHFLRGCWDGDGTCNITRGERGKIYYNITITGNYVFLSDIRDYLKNKFPSWNFDDFKKERGSNSDKIYVLRFGRKKNFQEFTDFLYKNSNIFLKRKYDLYLLNSCLLDLINHTDKKSYDNIPFKNKEELLKIKKYSEILSQYNCND